MTDKYEIWLLGKIGDYEYSKSLCGDKHKETNDTILSVFKLCLEHYRAVKEQEIRSKMDRLRIKSRNKP